MTEHPTDQIGITLEQLQSLLSDLRAGNVGLVIEWLEAALGKVQGDSWPAEIGD